MLSGFLSCLPLVVAAEVGAADSSARSDAGGARALCAAFEVTSDSGAMSHRGHLFYGPRGLWRVEYQAPVRQIFVVSETLAVLIYPEERRVLTFPRTSIEPPSPLALLIYALASNAELHATGLRIADVTTRGDTTVVAWNGGSSSGAPPVVTLTVHRLAGRAERLHWSRSGSQGDFRVESFDTIDGVPVPIRARYRIVEEGRILERNIRYSNVRFEARELDRLFDASCPPGHVVEVVD